MGSTASEGRSGTCSSAARNSKTRSAEASPDCSMFIWLAICMIGLVNWREYWMKAWMSPSEMFPVTTR